VATRFRSKTRLGADRVSAPGVAAYTTDNREAPAQGASLSSAPGHRPSSSAVDRRAGGPDATMFTRRRNWSATP